MRQARIKLRDRSAVYHCISRIVGGEYLLEDCCKEQFRRMMWQQADFCGIQLITYGLMTNHVHLLVRVRPEEEPGDPELVRRAEGFYGAQEARVRMMRQSMERKGRLPEGLRRKLLARMGDVSPFMKELKQRFSRWYNGQHDRFGTLWAERFNSVLVEDEPGAVRAVAAYIDLNPVRAGLVGDPKDYRFCGYGEAMGGGELARAGLESFLGSALWSVAGAEYRQMLFLEGGRASQAGQVVLERKRIRQVLDCRGHVSPAEALRLRVRYFSAGVVLGSERFVNEVFAQFRDRFGPRRKSGARKLRGLPFGELRTMRDLRRSAVS